MACCTYKFTVAENNISFGFNVNTGEQFDFDSSPAIQIVKQYEEYEGGYAFTPGRSAQTIETAGKVLAENITINPIPSNYGLITWNGSKLTVS